MKTVIVLAPLEVPQGINCFVPSYATDDETRCQFLTNHGIYCTCSAGMSYRTALQFDRKGRVRKPTKCLTLKRIEE